MILETYNSKKNNKYVIIGIGINFVSSPSIEDYKTTYIKKFVKINNKLIFLYNFFNNFFFYWHNHNELKKEISSKFCNSLMFLNEKIEINTDNNRSIKGIFKGIKHDGSIILDKDDKLVSIYSGNIKI
jgi:biotin-(acetyl-CoA carboxylase) ligase